MEHAPRGEDHAGIDLARRRLGDLAPTTHIFLFIFIGDHCGHLGISYVLFCHFFLFHSTFIEMDPLIGPNCPSGPFISLG